ncbi:MAG: recombinase family protein [Phycisphaerales bacterium]|nr:recombinase family protein [Phycisphaerales bacterium]
MSTLVMIAPQPQPAVAYLRRSTDRQEQSLADQRQEISRWAGANGYRLVGEYVDDAISGTSARARPGFQRMITDAAGGQFVAVIVYGSDRFSRGDVTETEHYRYLLRNAGVTVHSVTEDFLARDGIDGDVLRAVKQFQNRQFSISLSQVTLRGQLSAVLGASDPGRMAPYGYDREVVGPDGAVLYRVRFLEGGDREVRDRSGGVQAMYRKGQALHKPGKDCTTRLVLSDSARVEIVRAIFRLCIEGVGFKGIAAELNRRGAISPRGRLWQFTTVKALIENPVYRGDLVWNRRTESKFFEVKQGRADRMKPTLRSGRVAKSHPDDWIVLEGTVPAIVDRATWDRAQVAAANRTACAGGRGKQAGRWLLSGVLRCACCGQPLWGINKRKGRVAGRKDVVTPYYICAGRARCGKSVCPVPSHVRADALEAWVLAKLQEVLHADDDGVTDAVDRFVRGVREHRGGLVDTGPLRRELSQVEATADALVSGLDPANLAMVNARLTKLRKRKEHLQEQLRSAERQAEGVDEASLRRWATERVTLLSEICRGRRDERARQVIASYVDRIVVDPRDRTGILVFAGPTGGGVPGQKHHDPPRGGSQVAPIAGARVEPNLRPRGVTRVRFEWGLGGDGRWLRERSADRKLKRKRRVGGRIAR